MAQATKRLYAELEISPEATPEDIKKAYHKMALKYHPDKAGAAGIEPFKRVKAAYEVLSDPSKKKVYDQYGEQGLEFMNNPVAQPFMSSLGTTVLMFIVVFTMAYLIFTLILTLSFIASRVDGTVDWAWGTVFVPIWIWDAFAIITMIVATIILVKNYCEDTKDRQEATILQRAAPFLLMLGLLLGISSNIAVGASLDSDDPASIRWMYVLLPLIIAQFGLVLSYLPNANPEKLQAHLIQQGLPNVSFATCLLLTVTTLVQLLWLFVLLILIATKLDGTLDGSWYGVATPIYILLAANVVDTFTVAKLQHDNNPEQVPIGNVVCGTGTSFVINAMLLTSTVLICGKIEGASYPLAHAMIPIFILLAGLQLMLIVACFMFGMQAAEQLQMMEAEAAAEETVRQQQDYSASQPAGDDNAHVPQYMNMEHMNTATDANQSQPDTTAVNIAPPSHEPTYTGNVD